MSELSLPTELWTAVFLLLDEVDRDSFRQANFNFLAIFDHFEARRKRFVCSESLTSIKHLWRVSDFVTRIEYVSMRPEFIFFPESLKKIVFRDIPAPLDYSNIPKTIEEVEFVVSHAPRFAAAPSVFEMDPQGQTMKISEGLSILSFPNMRSLSWREGTEV